MVTFVVSELNGFAHAANTTRRVVGEDELAEIRSAMRDLRSKVAP